MATKPEETVKVSEKKESEFQVIFNRMSHQQEVTLKDGQKTFVPPNSKTPPILRANMPDVLSAGLMKKNHIGN